MISAPRADDAWLGMMRRLATRGAPGEPSAREAGKAAYAVLTGGEGAAPDGRLEDGQWLLLRDRTAARRRDEPPGQR